MKKILLSLLIIAAAFTVKAQDCTQLFISEYIEGVGNNKAIEIYNPTGSDIDLSDYRIVRYSNGSTSDVDGGVNSYTVLNGTIPACGTYIAVIDKRDWAVSTGLEAHIDSALYLRVVNNTGGFYCPDYNTDCRAFYHNGNDAVTLESADGTTIYDIFGKIGEDPGTSWTTVAPYTEAAGGIWITHNQGLIRKPSVLTGVSTNPTQFNALAEYDTVPAAYFWDELYDSLGHHNNNCNCVPTGISNPSTTSFYVSVYPNPVNNSAVKVVSTGLINAVSIVNVLGEEVYYQDFGGSYESVMVDAKLPSGTHFVRVFHSDESVGIKKLIVQ